MSGIFRRIDRRTGRPGKVWYGRIFIGGGELKRSLRTADRAEAQRRFGAWAKTVTAAAQPGRKLWDLAATEFFEQATHLKPSTLDRYWTSLRMVRPHLDGAYLDEIRRGRIAELVKARKAENATNRTIKRDLTFVSQVFAFAIANAGEDDPELVNPVLAFLQNAGGTVKEKKTPRPDPSDELIAKLVARAPRPMRNLILFLRHSGVREEEAVSLEWSQVRLREREVVLTETKTSRPRTIPLNDAAIGALTGSLRHIASPYVFWHGAGGRYRNFASNFARVAKAAGYPYDCHSLRHKFAREYLRLGGDIYKLKDILGHASVKTTEIYLDSATGDLHAEVKRLDRIKNRITNNGSAQKKNAGTKVGAVKEA